MTETFKAPACFIDEPDLLEVKQHLVGDQTPLHIGVGFRTLMKKQEDGGFVGQLAKDVAGVAVAGLPGLILAQGGASGSFYSQALILIYFKDKISIANLGHMPLEGGNYEEATFGPDWLRALRNGQITPEITSFNLYDIQIDYDELEQYSLLISLKEGCEPPGPYKFPLKITLPYSKLIQQSALGGLEGTAKTKDFVEQFHGTSQFGDPILLINRFKIYNSKSDNSKIKLPRDERLIEYAHNTYFMDKFMHEYNRLLGFTRKKILLNSINSTPMLFKNAVRQRFVEYAVGDKKHTILTKICFFVTVVSLGVGLGYLPFEPPRDDIGLSGFLILLGSFMLVVTSGVGEKVSQRKWYAKYLEYLTD